MPNSCRCLRQTSTVVCECASHIPNKAVAASEFRRVLKPGGQVGLNNLTRTGDIPEDLQGLLAWIACIADARPLEVMCNI